jgi:hypothetical protein
MKKAKDFMTEDTFWAIINASDKGRNLEAELNKLSEDEIMGYRYWWSRCLVRSYDQALWAVAYILLGGCGDDAFDYFRFWLVTRGRDIFTAAVNNPDSLYDKFETPTDGDASSYPEWEDVCYVPKKVFEKKFGKDFYEAEDQYDFNRSLIQRLNLSGTATMKKHLEMCAQKHLSDGGTMTRSKKVRYIGK